MAAVASVAVLPEMAMTVRAPCSAVGHCSTPCPGTIHRRSTSRRCFRFPPNPPIAANCAEHCNGSHFHHHHSTHHPRHGGARRRQQRSRYRGEANPHHHCSNGRPVELLFAYAVVQHAAAHKTLHSAVAPRIKRRIAHRPRIDRHRFVGCRHRSNLTNVFLSIDCDVDDHLSNHSYTE